MQREPPATILLEKAERLFITESQKTLNNELRNTKAQERNFRVQLWDPKLVERRLWDVSVLG